VRELDRLHLALPKGTRILFLHDPFKADYYTLLFTVTLHYGDPTLTVDRAESVPAAARSGYDLVLDYRDGRIVLVKN
jgi:hypothetical protein